MLVSGDGVAYETSAVLGRGSFGASVSSGRSEGIPKRFSYVFMFLICISDILVFVFCRGLVVLTENFPRGLRVVYFSSESVQKINYNMVCNHEDNDVNHLTIIDDYRVCLFFSDFF